VLFAVFAVGGFLWSLWVSQRFAYTGYWDDTLLVVGQFDRAPSDLRSVSSWVLDQQGDLNGPLVYLALLPGQWLGIRSNFLLILQANLALLSLIGVLVVIARRLGISRRATVSAALILSVSHVLTDQRTWFVPIQHTLTVLYSIVAVWATVHFLRTKTTAINPTWRLASLNFLLLLVGLGRETALPLSILVIVLLVLSRTFLGYLFGLSWTIPVIIQVQRTFSGRLGNRVEWFLEGSRIGVLRPSIETLASVPPSLLIAIFLPALTLVQMILVQTVNRHLSMTDGLTPILKHLHRLRRPISVVVLALWGTCLTFPRVGTPLLAILPPFHLFADTTIVRWQLSSFSPLIYLIGISISFATLFLRNVSPLLGLLCTTTFFLTIPYLIGQYESSLVDGPMGASSVSRYSVYFLPLAFFMFALMYDNLQAILMARALHALVLNTSVALLVVVSAVVGTQQLQRRAELYRSIYYVSCANDSYVMPTLAFERFRKGYLGRYVDDPYKTLVDDSMIKRLMKSVDTRPYTEDVDLAELNFSCTYPVEWLLEVVGPKVDGDVQQKLDQIRVEIGRTPESALRRRIQLLLESGLSS